MFHGVYAGANDWIWVFFWLLTHLLRAPANRNLCESSHLHDVSLKCEIFMFCKV